MRRREIKLQESREVRSREAKAGVAAATSVYLPCSSRLSTKAVELSVTYRHAACVEDKPVTAWRDLSILERV